MIHRVVLLLCGLVAVSTSFPAHTTSADPDVYEVYEHGEDESPLLNYGADANLIDGDILLPNEKTAGIDQNFIWTLPIPYILGDDLELNAKGCIHQAFEMYRLKSCIDFKPYEGEEAYIKFVNKKGCFSKVGNQRTGQILSLGSACDSKAVIEHELLHALGFYHEHSRTDRDDYVTIWLERVKPGHEKNFKKYKDDRITDLNTPYDYESIMHYKPFAFSNSTIPVITTKIPDFFNIIGQYLDMSKLDILKLNRVYNCAHPLILLDQCAFEFPSICGMIQASTDDADWIHTKSSLGRLDHTLLGKCRDAGFFMHFSTKTGKSEESALLESRILYPKRRCQCLQFFYKLTGSPKDRLVIWVKMDDGTGTVRKMKKLHTFYVDSDPTWKIAHIPMEVGVKFRYAFQGVRGEPSESSGGIYVDDVSLTETHCPNAVWRIQNFSKVLETADRNTKINSPHFYSPEGYGYGVTMKPVTQYSDYTGNYTGLYFRLVSGENDGVMEWPAVNRQATVVVLDQDPDIGLRMSCSRSFTTNMNKTSDGKLFWDKPSKVGKYKKSCGCYRGPALGWQKFIKHFDLRRRSYLKNDDLIIFIDFEDLTPLNKTEVPVKELSKDSPGFGS